MVGYPACQFIPQAVYRKSFNLSCYSYLQACGLLMVQITVQLLLPIVHRANRTVHWYSFNHKDLTVAFGKRNPSCSRIYC